MFSDRSTGKPSTIKSYKQTLDSLVEFFGADVPVDSITADGADRWRVWIVTEKKGSGRRKKKRIATDNRLAKATIAKRVSLAKQLFRAAIRWGMLAQSPFEGLRPGSQANPARAHYVPLRVIRDVLGSCPSIEWKLLVALARLGGLRCPSEVGALTWDHINWEKGRLMVLAPKTEHHGGEHAVRVVPICPELRAILAEAFDRAEPGATLVVPMAARPGVNFSTHLRRIILKAGHKPWDRLLQNLRASCETDWVERYPAHAVAKWLGHSPKVAAEHYLMSREHHFEDVVNRGAASSVTSAEEAASSPDEASECSAKCDAIETRNATPQAPASAGAESQKMTEPAATTGVTAGSAGITPITEIGKVGDIGLERTGFHSGNPPVFDPGGAESGADSEIPSFWALLGFGAHWHALSPEARAAIGGLPPSVLDELTGWVTAAEPKARQVLAAVPGSPPNPANKRARLQR